MLINNQVFVQIAEINQLLPSDIKEQVVSYSEALQEVVSTYSWRGSTGDHLEGFNFLKTTSIT